MEAEYYTWQVIIAREGLKLPFLLHGLLAMASLEIAALENPPNYTDYVSAALEYNDNALSSFRSELAFITPDKQQAALAFSMITMVLGLALPQFTKSRDEPQSMIENMVAHYGLVQGASIITLQHLDKLRKAPILRNIKSMDELQAEPLDPDVESAIARLNALNNEKHNTDLDQSRAAKLTTVTDHATCQKAILHLEDLFAKCNKPENRGYPLAWLNLTGRDYVMAVENRDLVALIILMHWGVLAERCGDGLWWAQSIGRSLVDEITATLPADNETIIQACISWARDQVNLTL